VPPAVAPWEPLCVADVPAVALPHARAHESVALRKARSVSPPSPASSPSLHSYVRCNACMPFGTQAKQKLCDAMIMDDENAEPEATTMSRANRMEAPIRREAEAIFYVVLLPSINLLPVFD
jgi:hypothetical protein